MSDHTVLADVGETLLAILRTNMAGLVATDHVTLGSPSDLELDTSPWLALYLFQVTKNPQLNNEPPSRPDPEHALRPPVVVDLQYLLIPYAQTRENEAQILGRAMQVFADYPVLSGSWLQGSLAGSGEALRVSLQAIPLDEMVRLWTAFVGKPYKLSVAYFVTPVRIDSALPPISLQPVRERDLNLRVEIP